MNTNYIGGSVQVVMRGGGGCCSTNNLTKLPTIQNRGSCVKENEKKRLSWTAWDDDWSWTPRGENIPAAQEVSSITRPTCRCRHLACSWATASSPCPKDTYSTRRPASDSQWISGCSWTPISCPWAMLSGAAAPIKHTHISISGSDWYWIWTEFKSVIGSKVGSSSRAPKVF